MVALVVDFFHSVASMSLGLRGVRMILYNYYFIPFSTSVLIVSNGKLSLDYDGILL